MCGETDGEAAVRGFLPLLRAYSVSAVAGPLCASAVASLRRC